MSNPDSAKPNPAGQPSRTRSRFTGLGAVALVVGAMVVLAIVFIVLLQIKQSSPRPSAVASAESDAATERDRLASLAARPAVLEKTRPGDAAVVRLSLQQAQSDLAALSARVARIETAPDQQSAAGLDDLDRRLSAMRADLELRVGVVERHALGSDIPQRIDTLSRMQVTLEARLAKLERVDPSVTMRHAAAELALANLVRASGSSGPFTIELQSFRTLLPDAPDTAELIAISRKGAPTRIDLVLCFRDVATAALAAERRAHAKNWLGRLWSNIGNVIIVRRIGDTTGSDSESVLARAGARLERGDLGAAISEVKSLKGSARTATQSWLNDAQNRLTIERDVAALANLMTTLLATP